ncbi:MAG: hypothetical protein JXA10_08740 [Anaerolineae bacterium]|nr:hypothetical protein [Anaerolineae bacterium]
MTDLKAVDYIANLPEVETARLPTGAMFFAQGKIYQVTETGGSGYHKARQWRQTEATDVALIPGSFPARYLPLVERGYLLPVYRSRLELTENNQPTCYVFPSESLSLDAAYLDVALLYKGDAYVRNHGSEPAFAVTDGVHVFRLFYYRLSHNGRKTDLSSLLVRPLPFRPYAHTDGPGYWRLLPSWTELIPNLDVTQPMKPINLEQHVLEEADTKPLNLDTPPHKPSALASLDE